MKRGEKKPEHPQVSKRRSQVLLPPEKGDQGKGKETVGEGRIIPWTVALLLERNTEFHYKMQ